MFDEQSGLIRSRRQDGDRAENGFIEAMGPDRFRVSEIRQLGGWIGGEDFSGIRTITSTASSITLALPELRDTASGVVDISGRWIEPLGAWPSRPFDKDDPSIRWVQRDKLWGWRAPTGAGWLNRSFEQADSLSDGLARVTLNGKVGFIDRTGNFAIEPTFDSSGSFMSGFGRMSAERDGVVGCDRQNRHMGVPNELPAGPIGCHPWLWS